MKLLKLPFFTADGTLSIPFASPDRYYWWRLYGHRLSVSQILAELRNRKVSDALVQGGRKGASGAHFDTTRPGRQRPMDKFPPPRGTQGGPPLPPRLS